MVAMTMQALIRVVPRQLCCSWCFVSVMKTCSYHYVFIACSLYLGTALQQWRCSARTRISSGVVQYSWHGQDAPHQQSHAHHALPCNAWYLSLIKCCCPHGNTNHHDIQAASSTRGVDLVLSSGFLSFANHAGFLAAMDEADVPVAGVMGTSAGALAGALYCAGFTPSQVAEELTRDPPLLLLRPCLQPWRGGFLSLHRVIARLEELLPPTFDQLQREFAVRWL